jgi:AraC-like DNA-binding protein
VKQAPTEGTVRVATFQALPAVLRGLGVNPAEVLAEVGLDLELFEIPDNRISLAARGRLLGHCVARTGCHHLGLLLGQRGGLRSFGLVGSLMKHAPNVRTALRSLVSYMHANVQGAVVALTEDDATALLSYDINQSRVSAIDQACDGAVAMMLNIMRDLCGSNWKPLEVWFAHRKPADIRPFRNFFRAPLYFDAKQSGLLFATRWLNKSLPNAEPELSRLLQTQVSELEARLVGNFTEQVRSVLRTGLLASHSSADRIAALFSIHPRTLTRRLTAEGISFRELVEEERLELARQMLENTTQQVNQIAESLGYARGSAFIRAFRQWSGTTPALWRAKRANRT